MKNRFKRALKALRENRGSGVVLVLVAISCITLMTTSLLHLSYTAFKMKAAERQNKVELYETDAKMDELVAKLQNEVSEAIKEAKKDVLVNFSSSNDSNNSNFRAKLVAVLESKLGKNDGTYNTDYLTGLLTNVVITKDSESTYTALDGKFTLKNVRITYTSAKSGNSTTITTDIILDASGLTYNGNWDIEKTVKLENWKVE